MSSVRGDGFSDEGRERDESGEVGYKPEGIRFLDRVRALSMKTPTAPTDKLRRSAARRVVSIAA